jgi:hypothetical protein
MKTDKFQELKQLCSDQKAILSALKSELAAWGDNPLPHQRATVQSCELWLISRQPFLGLSNGQQMALERILEMRE